MDIPAKISHGFDIYVPRKKEAGYPIDWEALAKSRNHFNNSAHEMFRQLYANSDEGYRAGKMSITKLAHYLNVSVPALSSALKRYGFDIKPKNKKCKGQNSINRTRYAYPYRRLGFKTELEMWEYFIENKATPKKIVRIIYESTGRCFLCTTVERHLGFVKKTKMGRKG